MTGTRAAFAAYFRPSALLSIRGTGLGWLIYILVLPVCIVSRVYNAAVALPLCLFAALMLANQYSQFLYQLSGKGAATLIPDYRRCQWRAFDAICAIVVLASTLLFWLQGVPLILSISIALFVFGLVVWSGFLFRFAAPAIAIAIYPPMFFDWPVMDWLQANTQWVMAAGAVGIMLFMLGMQRYMKGEVNRSAAWLEHWDKIRRKDRMNFEGNRLSGLNQWLFTRQLKRSALSGNKLKTIAAASYTPFWSSGIPALLMFIVMAGLMGYLLPQTGGKWKDAIDIAFLMACMISTLGTKGVFDIQHKLWPQYWLVFSGANRQQWMHRMAAAYLLVQGWSFLVVALTFTALATITGMKNIMNGQMIVIGLDMFLLVTASSLFMLPFKSRMDPLLYRLAFFALLGLGGAVGFITALSLSAVLSDIVLATASIVSIALYGFGLLIVALLHLPQTELAIREDAKPGLV